MSFAHVLVQIFMKKQSIELKQKTHEMCNFVLKIWKKNCFLYIGIIKSICSSKLFLKTIKSHCLGQNLVFFQNIFFLVILGRGSLISTLKFIWTQIEKRKFKAAWTWTLKIVKKCLKLFNSYNHLCALIHFIFQLYLQWLIVVVCFTFKIQIKSRKLLLVFLIKNSNANKHTKTSD